MLPAGVEAQGQQLAGSDAHRSRRRWHNHLDARIVVGEDLPVPAARTFDSPSVITHRNNVGQVGGAGSPCRPECNEFGARTTGEMVEVDSSEHAAVGGPDRCAHGVNAVFAWAGLGSFINSRAGQLNKCLFDDRKGAGSLVWVFIHGPMLAAGCSISAPVNTASVYAQLMSLGRGFSVLWSANAASNLADGLAFVSMPLLAASLTDDPRWVAGLATVYALVRLLVALPIGVWVDRADRPTLLAFANILRGCTVLAFALCLQFGAGSLLLLYIVFALIGTLESAADNASMSLVPALVRDRDLDRANGRISATQIIADEFAGPPLGGLLFALAAAVPIFAMGGLWTAAGFLALALPRRLKGAAIAGVTEPKSGRATLWAEAAAGARWLGGNRVVGALALIGALASVGYMLPFSILVLFAQQQLDVDSAGYGVILAASALGGLAGSFAAPRIRSKIGYRWTIAASLLTGAVSLLALSATDNGVVAALLLAAYILHAVIWGICATSLRQRLVPDELRGRVNAASRVLALLGLALGSALGGVLAVVHIALPVLAGGLVFLVCAVAAVFLFRPTDPRNRKPTRARAVTR